MLLQDLERNIERVLQFPGQKNVRILMEGLIVCRFDKNTANPSFADFLQFVDHHNLRFSLVKIDPAGRVTPIQENVIIPDTTTSMSIRGSSATAPDNYKHTPASADEFSLDLVLHLSKLHGSRFSHRSRLPEITTLRMEKTSFYTYERTAAEYRIRLGDFTKPPALLCKIIGGYIQCIDGTLDIDIPGVYTDKLNIIDSGVSYKYEISFTNHCEGDDRECADVLGEGGSDVKFLYQILQPDATPIILEEPTLSAGKNRVFSSDVAACLPATIEPFPDS